MRKVKYRAYDGTYEGFFHQFVGKADKVMAVIEKDNGKIELIPYTDIQFVETPCITHI